MATELLQLRDLACGTLFQSNCVILSPDITYGLFWQQLKGHVFREAWTRCSVTSDMWHHRKTLTYLLHPFNGLFSRTTWISQYEKGKTSLDLTEARDGGVLGCSDISWTICKQSIPRSRHRTKPIPHHSIFTGRMLFLMPNQKWQSTEDMLILHTHTHPFKGPFLGLPRWAGTRKVKPIWILLKQETVSGSGISWAICKSAVCISLQTDNHATLHHSVFYRLYALPAAQPTASRHWRQS